MKSGEESAYLMLYKIICSSLGLFYPHGGLPSIEKSLESAILDKNFGTCVIMRDVEDIHLILNERISGNETFYEAVGVDFTAKGNAKNQQLSLTANQSVVSGLGIICTLTKLVPQEVLLNNQNLKESFLGSDVKLRELKPRVKVVFWLDKTVLETNELSSIDYFESEDNGDSVHIWIPSLKDKYWLKRFEFLMSYSFMRIVRILSFVK